jgi:hypothetical protein
MTAPDAGLTRKLPRAGSSSPSSSRMNVGRSTSRYSTTTSAPSGRGGSNTKSMLVLRPQDEKDKRRNVERSADTADVEPRALFFQRAPLSIGCSKRQFQERGQTSGAIAIGNLPSVNLEHIAHADPPLVIGGKPHDSEVGTQTPARFQRDWSVRSSPGTRRRLSRTECALRVIFLADDNFQLPFVVRDVRAHQRQQRRRRILALDDRDGGRRNRAHDQN